MARNSENRSIVIIPLRKLHSFYKTLIQYPPAGFNFAEYQSVTSGSRSDSKAMDSIMKGVDGVKHLGIPSRIFASLRNYFTVRLPSKTSAIYVPGMISFKKFPFITDSEEALTSWMGTMYDVRAYHPIIEDRLESSDCKLIICWNNATYKSVLQTYNCSGFKGKIVTVYPAVALEHEPCPRQKNAIDILFLGSININVRDAFYYKGGHLVVEVYRQLKERYPSLRLTLRSVIPAEMRGPVSKLKDVTVVESPVTKSKLQTMMWNSDLMLLPSLPTPFLSFLDAMNHKLPVVTVDTHANSEIIESGGCGFACRVPSKLRLVSGTFTVPNRGAHKMIDHAWLHETGEIVDELVKRTAQLIEEPDTRLRMGIEGRKSIEPGGRFSIEVRNAKLHEVLNRVLS